MAHSGWRNKAWKIVAALLGLMGALGVSWWAVFGLKPYQLSPEALQARYAYGTQAVGAWAVQPGPVAAGTGPGHAFDLRFRTFDGTAVMGRIVYPSDPAQATRPFPVLLALHALGRTHWRWWLPEFKGRPTLENTHQVTALALKAGYAVVALDARGHGDRKGTAPSARELLRDLHLWGRREPYETMIVDTVKDYRVLLDWIVRQPQLDATRIGATGYSMGAQAALLLAGTDARVGAVAAMVPPHVDNKVAVVAPNNFAPRLQAARVWLLTADDDEHAGPDDNAALFAALPTVDKRHLRFPGGHVLPEAYVEQLRPWFEASLGSRGASASAPLEPGMRP
jgi:dienelactone hydrolase